jgi:hypothetical protein
MKYLLFAVHLPYPEKRALPQNFIGVFEEKIFSFPLPTTFYWYLINLGFQIINHYQ